MKKSELDAVKVLETAAKILNTFTVEEGRELIEILSAAIESADKKEEKKKEKK
jgi:hypothetical protein